MAPQLSSIAASSGLCLLSVLAIALLAVTIYILSVVASFAAFCIGEFVVSAKDRPPLTGTMFRMLKNFDRLFDDHVEYTLAHRTSRLVFPGHSEILTSDPQVIEHVLKTSFGKYIKVVFHADHVISLPSTRYSSSAYIHQTCKACKIYIPASFHESTIRKKSTKLRLYYCVFMFKLVGLITCDKTWFLLCQTFVIISLTPLLARDEARFASCI